MKKIFIKSIWDYDQLFKILLRSLECLVPKCEAQRVVHYRPDVTHHSPPYALEVGHPFKIIGDCNAFRIYSRRRVIRWNGVGAIIACCTH